MAGLTPKFNLNTVRQHMMDRTQAYEEKVIKALQYEGEAFVTKARLKTPNEGSFKDRTGALRSSIGYIILKDGKIITKDFDGKNAAGSAAGLEVATEVAAKHPKGIVLIGVAGMAYAAAVESKKYDVITGSAPGSNELKSLLNAIEF